MSLKASAFSLMLPAPKTLDKFYVMLPGNTQSLLRVSAASLPYPSVGEGVISFLGKPLHIPIEIQTSGEWTCTLEEDLALTGAMTISSLFRKVSNYSTDVQDIQIFLTDQITGEIPQLAVTLRMSYLKKVDPLPLDWSTPDKTVRWKLTFKYSGIKRWY